MYNIKTNNDVNKYYNIKDGNAPPKKRQKFKVKRQKSFRTGTLYFLLSPFSLTSRDGPRGREPANRVPVSLYPSVVLCVPSVNSVVKKERNHGEHGEATENTEIIPQKAKTFRWNCIPIRRLTEDLQEESLVFSVQSQCSVRNATRKGIGCCKRNSSQVPDENSVRFCA